MPERVVSGPEFESNVRNLARGVTCGSYRRAMSSEADIRMAILRYAPAKLEIMGVTRNGRPKVAMDNHALLHNIKAILDPRPDAVALIDVAEQMISEGILERIPCYIQKLGRTGKPASQLAYSYIQVGSVRPDEWVHPLNGRPIKELIHDSKKSSKQKGPYSANSRLYNLIYRNLPDQPTPDLVINPYETPGTVNYIARKLNRDTKEFRTILSKLLHYRAIRGDINRTLRSDSTRYRGHGRVNIYYK